MEKINPLLKNMINKVSIIEGAIDQCNTFKKGRDIKLNGLHTIIVKGNSKPTEWYNNRISELLNERHNLLIRISRLQ